MKHYGLGGCAMLFLAGCIQSNPSNQNTAENVRHEIIDNYIYQKRDASNFSVDTPTRGIFLLNRRCLILIIGGKSFSPIFPNKETNITNSGVSAVGVNAVYGQPVPIMGYESGQQIDGGKVGTCPKDGFRITGVG